MSGWVFSVRCSVLCVRKATWGLFVTAMMLLGVGAVAQEPVDGKDFVIYAGGQAVPFSRMADEITKADVVCVGENHDHKLGHRLELAILQAVQQRRPKMALSLEFFERDVQTVLDEYLQGHITDPHFRQASRPWPTYASDYAPMVEFCKANKVDVVAANAPRRYVNIVSRKGRAALADLPKESKQHFARLPYGMEIPAGYNQMLDGLFGGSHGTGGTGSGMPAGTVEKIKEAQGLWDATMADSILRYRKSHRGALVLQMNGAGHTDHGWGIVDRLRKANSRLKVVVMSIKPDAAFPSLPAGKYEGVAEYLVLTPEEAATPPR